MIRNELSATTGFADNRLDRRADLRDDPAAVSSLLSHPGARTVIVAGEIPVLKKSGDLLGVWFDLGETDRLAPLLDRIFLGVDADGSPRFGTLIDKTETERLALNSDLHITDLRSIAVQKLVPSDELGPLGGAKAMLDWHVRHRFCAQCGAPTKAGSSGWKRECPACTAQHFPRTDPVVIMLVVRGENCFLARQARFPQGNYSCIAGFLEPGETFEDAVRRETWEEAGLRTGKVRYMASQPWPFPSSLMIGCLAEALGDTITLDRTELEDGRWFSRDEALSLLDRRHEGGLYTPPGHAIANTLLTAWARRGEKP